MVKLKRFFTRTFFFRVFHMYLTCVSSFEKEGEKIRKGSDKDLHFIWFYNNTEK